MLPGQYWVVESRPGPAAPHPAHYHQTILNNIEDKGPFIPKKTSKCVVHIRTYSCGEALLLRMSSLYSSACNLVDTVITNKQYIFSTQHGLWLWRSFLHSHEFLFTFVRCCLDISPSFPGKVIYCRYVTSSSLNLLIVITKMFVYFSGQKYSVNWSVYIYIYTHIYIYIYICISCG